MKKTFINFETPISWDEAKELKITATMFTFGGSDKIHGIICYNEEDIIKVSSALTKKKIAHKIGG